MPLKIIIIGQAINELYIAQLSQTLPNLRFYFMKRAQYCTLQISTPWKLGGLGIAGSLQGKPALSMEKGL